MVRTILITGSTDGIGKLAAQQLANDGHEIYLHGRNKEKLEKGIAELIDSSKNKNIKGFVADFSDLSAVKNMAKTINEELPKIDVLINNAGVYKSSQDATTDGFDNRFVVNYFAPYLLTEQLLPLLRKGSAPRIINLSSAAQSSISYEALSGKASISIGAAYAQSKLALTMWSFHLAKKLPEMLVIAVNPGSLLNTRMVREGFGYHQSSADKGASILYQIAVAEEYVGRSGEYFDNDKGTFGKAFQDAYNEKEIEVLMSKTKTLLGS